MLLSETTQTASNQLSSVPTENAQDASFSQQFILRLNRNYSLFIVDQSIGWLYFFLWSVSFYPQVIMNFRRKSVVGFGFDYLGYDYVGFTAFSLYNCLLFWSPAVFNLYLDNYPGASNPIQLNDVLFCLHAVLIQVSSIQLVLPILSSSRQSIFINVLLTKAEDNHYQKSVFLSLCSSESLQLR